MSGSDNIIGKHRKVNLSQILNDFVTVEPVLFLFVLANFPKEFIYDQYIYRQFAKEAGLSLVTETQQGQCDTNLTAHVNHLEQTVQGQSARWNTGNSVIRFLPSLFSLLLIGSWSDIVGRKLVMVITIAGTALSDLLALIFIYTEGNVYYIYFASFVDGAFGSGYAILMASYAYIADTTAGESRSIRIIVLDITGGIAGTIATIPTGYIIEHFGFTYPLLYCMSVHTINLLYVVLYLREIKSHKAQSGSVSTTGLLQAIKRICFTEHVPKRLFKLWRCLVIIFLFILAEQGITPIQVIFLLSSPTCFTPVLLGYFNAVLAIVQLIMPLLFGVVILKKLGDIWMVVIGCLSAALFQLTFGFVYTVSMAFAVTLIGMFGSITLPVVSAFISKSFLENEQGALFASVVFTHNLSVLVARFVLNSIYSSTLHIHHGFVFFFTGVILVMTSLVAVSLNWM